MKNTIFLFAIAALVWLGSCQSSPNPYEASAQFDAETQFDLKYRIIRYIEHLPKKANDSTKFDEKYDEFYQKKATDLTFDLYHYDAATGRHYFSMSRIAPSLHEKKVATAGWWVEDEIGELIDYVESYRTWKMTVDELTKKNQLLFDKLVKGEDLSPYYNHNSTDEWIEFPDHNVVYNAEKRKWEMFR
jgi:hypothetical protein